jgi:methionyl-tRNA formyltransferase
MRVGLIADKWLGQKVFEDLNADFEVAYVLCPKGAAGLRAAAGGASVPVWPVAGAIPGGLDLAPVDLLVSVHSFAKVPDRMIASARAAVGYHPSLLPLFRGRNAVEDALAAGQRVTGGTVYHLTPEMDGGPVAFQDWCFVETGDTASSLWRRALAPMGRELISRAAHHMDQHGFIPAEDQERLDPGAMRAA